jgi:FkbM family methyltransferase
MNINSNIICRIDDFCTGVRPILPNLTPMYDILQEFDRREVYFYLGIVPALLTPEMIERLNEYQYMIPCQHGYEHCYDKYSKMCIENNDPYNERTVGQFDEFDGQSVEQIKELIGKGKDILEKAFNKKIIHYIAPCNRFTENTFDALCDLGFTQVFTGISAIMPDKYKTQLTEIVSDYYGRIETMPKRINAKSFCLHITWENDYVRICGFDRWAEIFKNFVKIYHNKKKYEEVYKKPKNNIMILKTETQQQDITLVINYYVDANKERQRELEYCLNKNIENKHIKHIVLIHEENVFVPKNSKIIGVTVEARPDFELIFNIANNFDGIKIISNSDIYFNDTILLSKQINKNQVFALCRWDKQKDNTLKFFNKTDSQDVWIYRDKINNLSANFSMGVHNCDNVLAYELQRIGVDVISPSEQIQAIHYHLTALRRYNIENGLNKTRTYSILQLSTFVKPENYNILFKFPVRGRKEKFFKTLDIYYSKISNNENFNFVISMDIDDKELNNDEVKEKLNKYKNLKYYYGNNKSKVEAINVNIPKKDWDIVVLVSDDMIPQIKGFDDIIREKMSLCFPDTDGVLWFNDGSINGDKLNTLCILGKKYYDRFNYIYHNDYKSLRCDQEFMEVANNLKKQIYIPDCIIRHEHFVWGFGVADELYKTQAKDWVQDNIVYQRRRLNNFSNENKKEIIFYTSINPSTDHIKRQLKAVKTWLKLNIPVISVNTKDEIKKIQNIFKGVKFISTTDTSEAIYGKPYIKINAILDIAKQQNSDCVCLINSDIELIKDEKIFADFIKKAKEGLVIVSRFNYRQNYKDARPEGAGLDVFAFNKDRIDVIPKSYLSLGQPVWDYWFPYQFVINNIPIFKIVERFAFHQIHKLQWSTEKWHNSLLLMNELYKFNSKDPKQISIIMRNKFEEQIKKNKKEFKSGEVDFLLQEIENPIIFELGANNGSDTINFSKILNSKVYAFECDPRNKLEHLPSNVVKTYNAISDKDGVEILTMSGTYNGKKWTESSSIKQPKNHLKRYPTCTFDKKIKVPCISLDTFCNKNNIEHIDFVWADLQGAEENMIKGGIEILQKTRFLYTEFSDNELYAGQITLNQILELLPDFEVVGIYGENVLLKNKNYEQNINSIPKKAFFIWSKGTPLSYLRYLTLESFRKLHPDYKIYLYLSEGIKIKNWNEVGNLKQEYYNKDKNTIKDYLPEVKKLGVEIREYNKFKNLNPAHISDLFRWEVLYSEGGWYFDLDQLFLNRINNDLLNNDFVFGGKEITYVGVLGAKKNLEFVKYVNNKQINIINSKIEDYLTFSVPLFKECLESEEYKSVKNAMQTENEVFYPVHWSKIPDIYEGKINISSFENTIALHWHGGHSASQEFNLNFNEKFIKSSNDSISTYLKEIRIKELNNINSKINLFFEYYVDSNKKRQEELEYCIDKNINSGLFDNIFVFASKNTDLSFFKQFKQKVYRLYPSDKKRTTFNDFFEATKYLENTDINILTNTDIYFDDTINLLKSHLDKDDCFALTRWNVLSNGKKERYISECSQDVWCFRGKVNINNCNFYIGLSAADNRVAYEIDKYGYFLTNPCMTIKAYHYHLTEVRNYLSRDKNNTLIIDTVPEPYKNIEATNL